MAKRRAKCLLQTVEVAIVMGAYRSTHHYLYEISANFMVLNK